MKKLLIALTATLGSASAIAQQPNSHETPAYLTSRWVIDLNLLGGMSSEKYTTRNSALNYPGALNMSTGTLKYTGGLSYGGDAQVGFFFGKMRHFGIGTGFMYLAEQGDARLNNYHVEYQATDPNGNIYRQVVSGYNIKEAIHSTNMNIPLVLKYKTRFSKHWGFSADAGALFNIQMKSKYTTNASFNYEAIYKFTKEGDAGTVSIYDNSPVPSPSDWFITRKEFLQNNPNGNYVNYVNSERAAGIVVGEGVMPSTRKGNNTYVTGSIGLLVQPSINYYVSDYFALNFGVYYMMQPFKNNAQNNYQLENGLGSYSSVSKNVTAMNNQDYGINIGARIFFGKKQRNPLTISSIDQRSPTECKLCDGSFTLHGMPAQKPVMVDFVHNGEAVTHYTTMVGADGNVVVNNLCAGTYTGISATINNQNAQGKALTISDPVLKITSIYPSNPTTGCDGSAKLSGLGAGKSASVTYNLDGRAQPTYTGIVNSDNTLTIGGLCGGSYSSVVATVGNCTANGSDFTLMIPKPTPPAPITLIETDLDINPPILFDFNQSTIHMSSYPFLNKTSKEMKEESDMTIRVDAFTDSVGSNDYNQKLSDRRATSVKTYLKKKGANPAKIKIYGHGESNPTAGNETAEGRSKNRRAIITRTDKK